MKNLIILLALSLWTHSMSAQQLRYVDSDYILSKIPQYEQAKNRLEKQVSAWKAEIKKDQDEIDALKVSLENERVILTDQKIEERESEIKNKEEKLHAKISAKFGNNGESQQLRINLVKPLQDQIWNAINTIAKTKGYHLIFDKAAGANLIYADAKYDITEDVIKEMGLDKVVEDKPKARVPEGSSKDRKVNSIDAGKIKKLEDKDRK